MQLILTLVIETKIRSRKEADFCFMLEISGIKPLTS